MVIAELNVCTSRECASVGGRRQDTGASVNHDGFRAELRRMESEALRQARKEELQRSQDFKPSMRRWFPPQDGESEARRRGADHCGSGGRAGLVLRAAVRWCDEHLGYDVFGTLRAPSAHAGATSQSQVFLSDACSQLTTGVHTSGIVMATKSTGRFRRAGGSSGSAPGSTGTRSTFGMCRPRPRAGPSLGATYAFAVLVVEAQLTVGSATSAWLDLYWLFQW